MVTTVLHYPDEVTDPSHFYELKDLPEPGKEEIDLMTRIVDKLTVDYDLGAIHNGYKELTEAMIEAKMKGQIAEVK